MFFLKVGVSTVRYCFLLLNVEKPFSVKLKKQKNTKKLLTKESNLVNLCYFLVMVDMLTV